MSNFTITERTPIVKVSREFFSVRVRTCLDNSGAEVWGDILNEDFNVNEKYLLSIRNFGRNCLKEVINVHEELFVHSVITKEIEKIIDNCWEASRW